MNDQEKIKRLTYALRRISGMAENAAYRIGRPAQTPSLGEIQTGFYDCKVEADEALKATGA